MTSRLSPDSSGGVPLRLRCPQLPFILRTATGCQGVVAGTLHDYNAIWCLTRTIQIMTESTSTQLTASPAVYLDPSHPIAERVQDLLSRLTLDEKIGQMCNSAQAIPRLKIPAYDFWGEALHGVARNGR